MYTILLTLHSLSRWLVLIAAVYAICRAVKGLLKKSDWAKQDDRAGMFFTSMVDIQLLLGLILYFFVSPITTSALQDFAGAMVNAGTRYFAVEHTSMMLIGLILAHIGRALSKKGNTDRQKHLRAATWFLIALIIILAAIPWPFMSAGRPLFRFG